MRVFKLDHIDHSLLYQWVIYESMHFAFINQCKDNIIGWSLPGILFVNNLQVTRINIFIDSVT